MQIPVSTWPWGYRHLYVRPWEYRHLCRYRCIHSRGDMIPVSTWPWGYRYLYVQPWECRHLCPCILVSTWPWRYDTLIYLAVGRHTGICGRAEIRYLQGRADTSIYEVVEIPAFMAVQRPVSTCTWPGRHRCLSGRGGNVIYGLRPWGYCYL